MWRNWYTRTVEGGVSTGLESSILSVPTTILSATGDGAPDSNGRRDGVTAYWRDRSRGLILHDLTVTLMRFQSLFAEQLRGARTGYWSGLISRGSVALWVRVPSPQPRPC